MKWKIGECIWPSKTLPHGKRGNLICFTISVREENLLKISRRVKEYKVEVLNPPREGKKLLVLDVDYTLFGELVTVLAALLPVTATTQRACEIVKASFIVTKVNHSV